MKLYKVAKALVALSAAQSLLTILCVSWDAVHFGIREDVTPAVVMIFVRAEVAVFWSAIGGTVASTFVLCRSSDEGMVEGEKSRLVAGMYAFLFLHQKRD